MRLPVAALHVVALVLGGCVALVYLYAGVSTRRQRRVLRQHLRQEETRAQFAALRYRLLQLALQEQLSLNSLVFKRLYMVLTWFIRYPEHYAQMARALQQVRAAAGPGPDAPAWARDARAWTPEVCQVAARLVRAMEQVRREYGSRWSRWGARLRPRGSQRPVAPQSVIAHILQVQTSLHTYKRESMEQRGSIDERHPPA